MVIKVQIYGYKSTNLWLSPTKSLICTYNQTNIHKIFVSPYTYMVMNE